MKVSYMRKMIMAAAIAFLTVFSASAQDGEKPFYGLGNRLGVGLGVGTEGYGIDVATSFNKYFGVRLGLNIMPATSFGADVDVDASGLNGTSYTGSKKMNVSASMGRTSVDLKFDCYPFPNQSSFFVTAGFSFGGPKLIKVTGHSDEYAALVQQGKELGIEIGDYNIPIDANGDVSGGVKVSGFRPYLGLGFGRLIPKGRVGFRFEMGLQFHGTPELYADGVDLKEIMGREKDDDLSNILDKLTVYPVLKLSLRGRIL